MSSEQGAGSIAGLRPTKEQREHRGARARLGAPLTLPLLPAKPGAAMLPLFPCSLLEFTIREDFMAKDRSPKKETKKPKKKK